MSLSRKHYKAIAEIIRVCKTKNEVMECLANYFEEDNAWFDRFRFYEACGYLKR